MTEIVERIKEFYKLSSCVKGMWLLLAILLLAALIAYQLDPCFYRSVC